MRLLATFGMLLLVTACGSGSSAPAPRPTPPALTEAARARATDILESCALVHTERLEELLGVLEQMGEPLAPEPAFRFTGFLIALAQVNWALDLEPDGTDDVTGSFRFEDAAGRPTLPFNPLEVLGGSLDLPSLLASLPDGTVLVVDFVVPPRLASDPSTSGHVEITFEGGAPSAVSGSASALDDACSGSVSFEDLEAADVLAAYPTATLDLAASSADGELQGTLMADGTSTALLVVLLDGTETFRYAVDLDSWALTPLP